MSSDARPWVDGLTIGAALEKRVFLAPDREAVVFPHHEIRLSYQQLLDEIRAAARALISLGVQRGEHVGVWCTNWPQWVVAQFAAALIGAPLVNINPAYRARELEYVLKQAKITVLITLDRFKTTDYYQILNTVCPKLPESVPGQLRAQNLPSLRTIVGIKNDRLSGVLPWADFVKLGEKLDGRVFQERRSQISAEDVVNIQYTSGTTGFPKGVQLTHRNILLNAFYVGRRMHVTSNDRICMPVPFYHCFGCVLGTLANMLYGATLVVPSEAFDAEATLTAVADEKCTALYGVPAMFIAELSHPEFNRFDLSSLRTGIMAGSPCPVEVVQRVIDTMGAEELTIAYGLTEASPVVTQTDATDSVDHRVHTVGTPLPGLEVKIADVDTGVPLPQGRQGELMVRGHCVMQGYFDLPEETAETITPDGWLHTGDLATQTTDGYYKITGRIKDMIIRGGENIYPLEIEEFLFTMPQIQDVQVVGLPDDTFGEVVSAWIIPKAGQSLSETQVREYCRDRIAYYKIPKFVILVDEYPTTVSGKVQKFKLRDQGIKRFGLARVADTQTA